MRFGLRGLFGIDFLLDHETVQPVELNPRYPASVEILELAFRASAISLHAQAFTTKKAKSPPRWPTTGLRGLIGKAVVYAPRDGYFRPALSPQSKRWKRFGIPAIADVPAPGTHIARGSPIATVFASAPDETQCLAILKAARKALVSDVKKAPYV